MNELESRIKLSLLSRRIPFNIYSFKNDSIVVMAIIRGRRMSVNIAYTVTKVDDEYQVSTYDKVQTFQSSSAAAIEVVNMIRKQEIFFAKYTKKS